MPSRTSRKQPIRAEDPLGSEQTAASFARDKAAQPALLAAAANATPIKKKTKKPKGLINLKSLVSPTGAGSSSSSAFKSSKAVFTLTKAKYQKGDKKGELSGAIYFRGKPRYCKKGGNDLFKAKVEEKLLTEKVRWNDELKLYTAKVYTPKQANMVLDAMRKLSPENEKDLDGVTVDESIFEDAKPAEIKMFPIEVESNGGIVINDAIGGTTYPWNKVLKDAGFSFNFTVNGKVGVQLWLRPETDAQPEVDIDDLEAMFEEYGFTVEKFDGVDSDDEDSD